jgi:four helix bundle protein
MMVKHFRDLRVYQSAREAAMELFAMTKKWPGEERYSLVDQIRRSSRSVCGNLAEAWRKRRYPAHFCSKLSDSDGEAAETQVWLEFAHRCGYLPTAEFEHLDGVYDMISGGLVKMMENAEQWCGPSILREDEPVYGTILNPTHTPTPPNHSDKLEVH